ncbi:MAG: response regulator [Deltaproteobacteria bacterium]
MKEIISWLLDIERMAGQLYAGAARLFPEDGALTSFLTHLADDEALHALAMGSALNKLHSAEEVVLLDEAVRQEVEAPFRVNLERLRTGTLDRQSLLECIVATEFSEWNKLFLYVINLLKESSREFQFVAASMHSHQKMISEFFAKEPDFKNELATINALPKIWKEKILLVDDSEAIRELMEAILEDEALVEKAADAGEGLRKLKGNYFDLVISDVNMPGIGGVEFYEQAVELDPNLKDRFLFHTGYPAEKTIDFLKSNGLPYLLKPTPISEFREIVRTMLQGQRV